MSKRAKNERKLIIKGHKKNPIVKFWNWGWNIYYDNPELWNYVIVGALTTFINLITKWILYNTVIDVNKPIEAQIAVIISWVVAVLFAYVTNRIFVFVSKSKNILKELLKFISSRLVTYFLEALLTFIFFNVFNLTTKVLVIIITLLIQVIIMALNYIFSKLFVFKNK